MGGGRGGYGGGVLGSTCELRGELGEFWREARLPFGVIVHAFGPVVMVTERCPAELREHRRRAPFAPTPTAPTVPYPTPAYPTPPGGNPTFPTRPPCSLVVGPEICARSVVELQVGNVRRLRPFRQSFLRQSQLLEREESMCCETSASSKHLETTHF